MRPSAAATKPMIKPIFITLLLAAPLPAQLDPTRNLPPSPPSTAAPLPEQYLWTANDSTLRRPDHNKFPWNRPDLRVAPHFFRAHFTVTTIPIAATLYVAGPREAHVYLNGHLLGDFATNIDAPINFRVFHAAASSFLQKGDNILAISAIRGKRHRHRPRPAPHLRIGLRRSPRRQDHPRCLRCRSPTHPHLRPTMALHRHRLRRLAIPRIQRLRLARSRLPRPHRIQHRLLPVVRRRRNVRLARLSRHVAPLSATTRSPPPPSPTSSAQSSSRISTPSRREPLHHPRCYRPKSTPTPNPPPSSSTSAKKSPAASSSSPPPPQDATLSIAYGESELEAQATGLTSGQQGGNYLGTNLLDVPANGTARGPKSAFRYVRIRFLRGAPTSAPSNPSASKASTTPSPTPAPSSPPTRSSTASGNPAPTPPTSACRTASGTPPSATAAAGSATSTSKAASSSTAFGDSALLEDTLRRLAESTPASAHVNGIPSYTALWITSLATLYQHSGDKAFLASQHDVPPPVPRPHGRRHRPRQPPHRLPQRLELRRLGPRPLRPHPRNPHRHQPPIPPRLLRRRHPPHAPSATPPTPPTTQSRFETLTKARRHLRHDRHLGPPGSSIPSPSSPTSTRPSTWSNVLAHVKQDAPTDQVISPYFGAYLLDAMSLPNTLKPPSPGSAPTGVA